MSGLAARRGRPRATGAAIGFSAFVVGATLLSGCHDKDDAVDPAHFTEFSVREGSEPRTLQFEFVCEGGPANHLILQVDPDGLSGFSQADINDDGVVNENDRISTRDRSAAVPIPLFLTDFDNAVYRMAAVDSAGNVIGTSDAIGITDIAVESLIGYFKASNNDPSDQFGDVVALSADGNTLAVGVEFESSADTGVNGDQTDNSAPAAGAVYVFTRDAEGWSQEAYIKASNTEGDDRFGAALALSDDGTTLAVGAFFEDSAATGINGGIEAETDNSADSAGAVYVFTRDQTGIWSQQAYIKASNTDALDNFGTSVGLSDDGATLAVGATGEASAAVGINGGVEAETDNSAGGAGAVYVFTRDQAGNWSQQAYIKPFNTDSGDFFGADVALSDDGNTLAVGAYSEDSDANGINQPQQELDNSATDAGAAYVFTRAQGQWLQQAYIKASNSDAFDFFGIRLALSDTGDTLAVGAVREDSAATGVGGEELGNSAAEAGAAYVFTRMGGAWDQQAYIKASNTDADDRFGSSIALADGGDTLAVGALLEDGAATGLNGDQTDNSADGAGAVYVFKRLAQSWSQQAYVKASNTEAFDFFGVSVALADGGILAVGADGEDSAATGIGGDQSDNSSFGSGAVYLF